MQNLLLNFRHIYKNTLPDEPTDFSINIIKLLCQQANKQHTKFSARNFYNHPTSFLSDINKQLKAAIKQLEKEYSEQENKPTKQFSLKSNQEQIKEILWRKKYNIRVVMAHIPYTKQIYKNFRELNSSDVSNWVIVTGTVIQSTQKKALQKAKYFRCLQCGIQFKLQCQYHNSYRFQLPNACNNMVQKQKAQNFISKIYQNFHKKKNQTLPKDKQKQQPKLKNMKCGSNKFQPIDDSHKKICIDYQELKVQQPFKHILSGKLPQTITVLVQGVSFDQYRPGDDVTISGMLDYRYKKLIKDTKVQNQLIIFANNITISKQNKKEQIQEQQRSQLSDNPKYSQFSLSFCFDSSLHSKDQILARQLKFRRQVLKSFCPTIYGRDLPKLAIILGLLGGVNYETENTKIRGQSHVLLIGEPGTGKSVLLQAAAKVAERSFMTNGIGTTSAGLSVSYFKEGGDWTIQAGALVLADNGVCCIDQLTLLSKKDEKSLLQAMQQQTISSAKASVVGKLNARTTIIAACNPITPHQKYDQNESLQTNTGLSIPLLTRFDLIIILKDDHQIPQDIKKCDYILDKFMISQDSEFHKPYSKISNQSKPSQSQLNRQTNIKIKTLLKKCKIFTPELSQHDIIKSYYTEQRKKTQKVTTVRTFQSLCRLTEAHAKLMMRDTTTQFDCLSAIMLMENRIATTIEQYYNYLDQFNTKFNSNFKP